MPVQLESIWIDAAFAIGGSELRRIIEDPQFVETMDRCLRVTSSFVTSGSATLDEYDVLHVEDPLLESMCKHLLEHPHGDDDEITHLWRCTILVVDLEASRTKLFWEDLSLTERQLLEPAVHLSMQNDPAAVKKPHLIPKDGRSTSPLVRFIVWWSRNYGRLPQWAARAMKATKWGILVQAPCDI